MTPLETLASRVEALGGADREVDRDITIAIFPWVVLRENGDLVRADGLPWAGVRIRVLDYTASIDAAMTLVPEDMRDEIEITTLYCVARVTINMNHGPDGSPFYGSNESNSIPLAICAAALRAIAATRQEGR